MSSCVSSYSCFCNHLFVHPFANHGEAQYRVAIRDEVRDQKRTATRSTFNSENDFGRVIFKFYPLLPASHCHQFSHLKVVQRLHHRPPLSTLRKHFAPSEHLGSRHGMFPICSCQLLVKDCATLSLTQNLITYYAIMRFSTTRNEVNKQVVTKTTITRHARAHSQLKSDGG